MMTLEDFKNQAAKDAGAKITRQEAFAQRVCIFCGASCKPADFKDAESVGEYRISGMCQKCQDEIFGE